MKIVDHTADVRGLVVAAKAALDRVIPVFAESHLDNSHYVNACGRDLLAC